MARRGPRKRKILKNKTLLLGVSGGVAAYKAIDLTRRLRDCGASVHVVMTDAARSFVAPLSFEVASDNKVHTSLFDEPMAHIHLPARSDALVVAPATANIIGKFASGVADDILSTSYLAFCGPVIIAPAMNWRMYEHPTVRTNLSALRLRGVIQVGPESGALACGEEGIGRMAEVAEIVDAVGSALSKKDLAGERVVVTAGPTREYIDPVRFISNRSSGKMGYALARAARNRGAEVVLISGPSAIDPPSGLKFVRVETSEEMLGAVKDEIGSGATVLIMAAAVADFSPSCRSDNKIEKKDVITLDLRKTVDIISHITERQDRPFVIGFSAEAGGGVERAELKMKNKGMDMIVYNDVTEPGAGFDVDTNRIVIIDGRSQKGYDLMSKDRVAEAILDRFVEIKA